MKEPKGAALLASHLLDPAITDDDVRRAATALATLATRNELPTLLHFFAMYRGTAESDDRARRRERRRGHPAPRFRGTASNT